MLEAAYTAGTGGFNGSGGKALNDDTSKFTMTSPIPLPTILT